MFAWNVIIWHVHVPIFSKAYVWPYLSTERERKKIYVMYFWYHYNRLSSIWNAPKGTVLKLYIQPLHWHMKNALRLLFQYCRYSCTKFRSTVCIYIAILEYVTMRYGNDSEYDMKIEYKTSIQFNKIIQRHYKNVVFCLS